MNRRVVSILKPLLALMMCVAAAALALQGLRGSDWYRQRLVRDLFSNDAGVRLYAAATLAELNAQRQLLETLRSDHDQAREMARRALEHIWFYAAGETAYRQTQAAYQAAERDDLHEALALLNDLVRRHPGYAEAWNQRASVYWRMNEVGKSMADCRRTLALNPNHYGAWQGLGLCQLQQGDLLEACASLRAALRLLPHDAATRQSLQRCEALLRHHPTGRRGESPVDIL